MIEAKTSWEEYRLLIVSELERLNLGIAGLNTKSDTLRDTFIRQISDLRNDDINKMKMDISNLKLKLAMLGVLAGGGGASAVELIRFMMRQ